MALRGCGDKYTVVFMVEAQAVVRYGSFRYFHFASPFMAAVMEFSDGVEKGIVCRLAETSGLTYALPSHTKQ